jgi:hypothetical protein
MRKQFRQFFRQTIAETVDAAGDVNAEMRYIVAVLSARKCRAGVTTNGESLFTR